MADCKVEMKCKYGIGDVIRYNILVDTVKYSKNFQKSSTTDDDAKKDAQDACNAGIIDTIWDAGWALDCVGQEAITE